MKLRRFKYELDIAGFEDIVNLCCYDIVNTEENVSFVVSANVFRVHEHIGIDTARSHILYAGLELLM